MSGAARRWCWLDKTRGCEPTCAAATSAVGPWGSFCVFVESCGAQGVALTNLSKAAGDLQTGLGAVPPGMLSKFAGVLLGGRGRGKEKEGGG